MRARRLLLLAAAAALLSGALPASAAMDDGDSAAVSIEFAAFTPPRLDVLAGDTTRWSNDSGRQHTVTAVDGGWTSARLSTDDTFAHRFDVPGGYLYYCQIHPFMRGEVDVFRVLLTAPTEPAAPNRPFVLTGRAALPEGSTVALEEEAATGPRPAGTATVGPDGGFHATIAPSATTTFRAVAGGEPSPPVQVLVLDRSVTMTARRAGRRWIVVARVTPSSPGARVVLQLHLKERFGWWPTRRARVGSHSTATFRLGLHRRVKARVVLTLRDGATALAESRVVRIGTRR